MAAPMLTLLLFSSFLSSLDLSDTKVYEPYIRALFGTASHFCKVVVLKLRTVRARSASRQGDLLPTPYSLNPTPHTLHPTPYALHPTRHPLHPDPTLLKALGGCGNEGDVMEDSGIVDRIVGDGMGAVGHKILTLHQAKTY